MLGIVNVPIHLPPIEGIRFVHHKTPLLKEAVQFGEIPEKVARYSQTPVMIVKRYEGPVKSIVKRVMGGISTSGAHQFKKLINAIKKGATLFIINGSQDYPAATACNITVLSRTIKEPAAAMVLGIKNPQFNNVLKCIDMKQ